jgi:DNA-binding SARP family transcriptional activator/predicted ATPase
MDDGAKEHHAMSWLELKLLGVPEVTLDGRPIAFARRGSIALLAYLALAQRARARESLATLLAGDSSDEQARKYLSNVLVDLRQQLGNYIVATRQTVAFDRSLPHSLDVTDFQARIRVSHEDPDNSASPVLGEAIGLYRDEFLAGLTLAGAPDFESWLFAQREELRGLYMQALRAEVDASLRHDDLNTGIVAARRLIAEEPWLEEAHRQLMVMLAHSGQRQAAMAQYHTCRRILREELGVEPLPETIALFNRLRAAITPPRHNLPPTNSPLVGRAEELRLVNGLLAEPDSRLVTITGLGGSGKTRLALEVGRRFATPSTIPPEQPFPDGIVFVALADSAPAGNRLLDATSATQQVVAACAAALSLPVTPDGDPFASRTAAVLEALRTRAMLLILDNFEHLQAGASIIQAILEHAPYVKILVSSRLPVYVEGERVLHVDGLRLPSSSAELESAEASSLFLQEAQRVHLGYELAADERPQLVTLCRVLGGFPLALVLAARWAPVLRCSVLLAELNRGLDVLATSEPDLPERHRSLEAIIDSTLNQLTTSERAFAQSLAEAATDGDGDDHQTWSSAALLPGVRALHERTLLSVDSVANTLHPHPLLKPYVRGRRHAQLAMPVWVA